MCVGIIILFFESMAFARALGTQAVQKAAMLCFCFFLHVTRFRSPPKQIPNKKKGWERNHSVSIVERLAFTVLMAVLRIASCKGWKRVPFNKGTSQCTPSRAVCRRSMHTRIIFVFTPFTCAVRRFWYRSCHKYSRRFVH